MILTTKSKDNEVLFQHAELITDDDTIDWQRMIQYCKENKLQWLALPQIGISKSGFVAYFFWAWQIVINPVIAKTTELTIKSEEKCASVPGESFVVDRKHTIIAKYDDKFHFIPYPASIVFQHEYDHLNGILLNSY